MFLPFMVLPILQPTISAAISIEYLRLVRNKSLDRRKWRWIWREESQFLLNRYCKYKLTFLCCLPLCSLYANDHIILTYSILLNTIVQKCIYLNIISWFWQEIKYKLIDLLNLLKSQNRVTNTWHHFTAKNGHFPSFELQYIFFLV